MNRRVDTGRAESDPLIGQAIADRYLVEAVIARGSMGKVYRARQTSLGRVVAIKVLAPNDNYVVGHDNHDQRFMREASILARLTHPNTVRVYDFGLWNGSTYLVMEYLEGSTLRELTRDKALEPTVAIHIVRQVVGSLHEAHATGVVHRDLKPSNILIVPSMADPHFVKVIDFGLVKEIEDAVDMTGDGMMLGTPMYMAPEQIRGLELDQRSDIYAAGMVLYRLLTGATPWPASGTAAVLMSHMTQEPPPFALSAPGLVLPACLEWTTLRCLEKRPQDRFRDGRELDRALRVCEKALADGMNITMTLQGGLVVLPDELTIEPTMVSAMPPAPAFRLRDPPAWVLAMAAGSAGLAVATTALVLLVYLLARLQPPAAAPVVSPMVPMSVSVPRPEPRPKPVDVPEPPAAPLAIEPADVVVRPAKADRASPRPPRLIPAAPPPATPPPAAPPPADDTFKPKSDLKDPWSEK